MLQIIEAADEVVDSVDTDELMKYFAFKNDPEDEGAEVCIYVACCYSCHSCPHNSITEALALFYGMIV